LGFGLAGVAVAGVALGGAMSGLAAAASSDVQGAAGRREPFTGDLRDTESNGKTFDTVSIVGYVIGAAAAIGAGVSLYFAYRPRKGATALAPLVAPQRAGLVLSGSF
jgi:hypothetical protein